MQPLISILIPVYNAGHYIGETIESALAQTWEHKEIILVDDGSTDNSLEVAETYKSKGVKVITQAHQGGNVARNRALHESHGAFLQYLDADDLISPKKIESQIVLLQQCARGMLAVCKVVYFFEDERPENGISVDGWPLINTDDPIEWLIDLLGPPGTVPNGAWLIPRQVAEAAGNWNEDISANQDGEYFARVVIASTGIRRTQAGTFYYRQYRGRTSVSRSQSEDAQWGRLRAANSIAEQLLARTDSSRARQALARVFMNRAVAAYPGYPKITESALRRVAELGGTDFVPSLGGWRVELIKRFFGWRIAKRVNSVYRRLGHAI